MRAAKPRAGKQVLNITQQTGPPVHQVFAIARAIEAATDGDALAGRDGDFHALALLILARLLAAFVLWCGFLSVCLLLIRVCLFDTGALLLAGRIYARRFEASG